MTLRMLRDKLIALELVEHIRSDRAESLEKNELTLRREHWCLPKKIDWPCQCDGRCVECIPDPTTKLIPVSLDEKTGDAPCDVTEPLLGCNPRQRTGRLRVRTPGSHFVCDGRTFGRLSPSRVTNRRTA